MSQYTMYLKDAIDVDPNITDRALTEYPIFNEDYRDELNKKIIDHFWNREIGMETVSMFEFALRRKMNEIMPLYNQHYETSLIAAGIDPLQTMKVSSESQGSGEQEANSGSNSSSTTKGKSRAIGQDFPQTMLAGDGDYASNGQDNVSEADVSATGAEKTRSKQAQKNRNDVRGSHGQASVLLFQHRQTLVNVDLMVLNELNELFMGLWSTGDSFTKGVGFYGYGFGLSRFW